MITGRKQKLYQSKLMNLKKINALLKLLFLGLLYYSHVVCLFLNNTVVILNFYKFTLLKGNENLKYLLKKEKTNLRLSVW